MSRIPTVEKDENPIPKEISIVGVTTRSGAVLDPRRPENSQALPFPLAKLATAQQADNFCQKVQRDLNTTEASRFYANGDGILCRQGHQQEVQKVVVSQSLTKDILQREHSSPLGAHPGGTRMYHTLRRRYYWPSLVADVFGWVAACPTCAKNRLMETWSTASMHLFPAKEPFAAVALDLLGPREV